MTLDTLPPLTRAEITGVDWTLLAPEEAKRLRAMGIDQGAEVSIAHRGIFVGRDPIAIEIGRMTVALRRVHARAMSVRVLCTLRSLPFLPPRWSAIPMPARARCSPR